ncbi:MAG: gluconokinase [Caldilineales bacterium]|nr:gluconokinase [Caldilineales bacterium]
MDDNDIRPNVSTAQAEPPLILALDIGTSSFRALLFDRFGRHVQGIEARVRPEIRTQPAGASEADPQALLRLIFDLIDDALTQCGDLSHNLAAVAIDSFVNNVLGLDAAGGVSALLTTYADTRSSGEVPGLKADFAEAETHNRTGCRFHPSYLPARLRWLHRTQPDSFAVTRHWLSLGEYLELELFGETAVSYSTAAWTGLLDRRKLAWDSPLLEGLPITEADLSPLTDLNHPRQGLRPDYARRWPDLAEIPWFPALGDGAAANIGSGCWSSGRVALTVGTTSALRAVVTEDVPELPTGLWCYRVDGRRSLPGGALTEGGMLFAWMQELLRLGDSRTVERELAALPPDGHGLTVLPFLAGERSPGWAGDRRAAIVGLTQATTPLEIVRAGLESVAYRIALVFAQLRHLLPADPEIIVSGGALLASPVWLQIMADALGRPLRVSRAEEATARGAALLALESLGVFGSITDAPDFVGEQVRPDLARTEIYRQAIVRQQQLYDKLA